jgi:hypothetical protein
MFQIVRQEDSIAVVATKTSLNVLQRMVLLPTRFRTLIKDGKLFKKRMG